MMIMKHYPIILAGEERETKEKIKVRNPFNQEVIATVSYANENHLNEAIEKADSIFPVTRKIPSYKRAEILLNGVDQLRNNAERIRGEFSSLDAVSRGVDRYSITQHFDIIDVYILII